MILTRAKIEAEFARIGAYTMCGDETYETVDLNWATGVFHEYAKAMLAQLASPVWKDIFDCNRFARFWCALMDGCYGRQKKAKGTAPACGEFWYYNKGMESAHAVVIIHGGRKAGWKLIEPQLGCLMQEDPFKCDEIYKVRF